MIIDLPIGTIVKSKGKRGIIEESNSTSHCNNCMLLQSKYRDVCYLFKCTNDCRKDEKEVIVKEIKE